VRVVIRRLQTLICTLCRVRCLLIRNPRTFQFFRIRFGLRRLLVGFDTCPLSSSTQEGSHLVEQCNLPRLGLVPPICQQEDQGPSVRQIVDSQGTQELPCPRLLYSLQGRGIGRNRGRAGGKLRALPFLNFAGMLGWRLGSQSLGVSRGMILRTRRSYFSP